MSHKAITKLLKFYSQWSTIKEFVAVVSIIGHCCCVLLIDGEDNTTMRTAAIVLSMVLAILPLASAQGSKFS